MRRFICMFIGHAWAKSSQPDYDYDPFGRAWEIEFRGEPGRGCTRCGKFKRTAVDGQATP